MHGLRAVLTRLFRSALGGGAATLVDLAVLTGLVSLAGQSPRGASIPALVAGGIVAFVTQKYFAFEAPGGRVARQVVEFAVVQIGSAVMTGLLFDLALRFLPRLTPYYVIVRLVTSNVVWLGFSFPLWHWVFRREIKS